MLDRTNGKPVWPIPEKKVPQGQCAGRMVFADPAHTRRAAAFRQAGRDAKPTWWTGRRRSRRGRWRLPATISSARSTTPPPVVNDKIFGALNMPGLQGGTNWPGGSYDPETHIVYLFAKNQIEVTGVVRGRGRQGVPARRPARGGQRRCQWRRLWRRRQPEGRDGPQRGSSGRDGLNDPIVPGMISIEGIPLMKPPYGTITAIDLGKGTMAWQIVHGETPDHIKNHPPAQGRHHSPHRPVRHPGHPDHQDPGDLRRLRPVHRRDGPQGRAAARL